MPTKRKSVPVHLCTDCHKAIRNTTPKMPAKYGRPPGVTYRFTSFNARYSPVSKADCDCQANRALHHRYLRDKAATKGRVLHQALRMESMMSGHASLSKAEPFRFGPSLLPQGYVRNSGSRAQDAMHIYESAVNYETGAERIPTGPDDDPEVQLCKAATSRFRDLCRSKGVHSATVAADPLKYFDETDWT